MMKKTKIISAIAKVKAELRDLMAQGAELDKKILAILDSEE